MRLPGFLIIGAMKAGTTTLYRDLLTNDRVFMPLDKEPNNLDSDSVLSDKGREAYARLFAAARPDQVCGEASTRYTKLPDHTGVPLRAWKVLGPTVRLIYLVREPIARVISHHYHNYSAGGSGPDINVEVRKDPTFTAWGRYAMQVEPWIDTFGRDAVRIVKFEAFVRDRAGTIASLCEFLGVPPRPELIDPQKVFNKGDNKPIARGLWSRIAHSPLYRRTVRPLLSPELKDRIQGLLLPKAPPRPPPPSPDTVSWLLEGFADDVERLRVIMGEPGPLWDLDAVRRKYASAEAGGAAEEERRTE